MLKNEYEFKKNLESFVYRLIGIFVYITVANFFVLEILNGSYFVLKKIGITNMYILISGAIIIGVIIYANICFFVNDIIYKCLYYLLSSYFSKVRKVLKGNKLIYFLVFLLNKLITVVIVIIFISILWYAYKLRTAEDLNINTSFERVIVSIVNDISIADFVRENNNEVKLYNGTKLEDAVKSTQEISKKVEELMVDKKTSLEKAICIYDWIGSNISYDYQLAYVVSSSDMSKDGEYNYYGAKYAFENLSGICFDFASLYVVMAKEAGLPVRLIIGDAYDGFEFGSHAWNQVYIEEEERWINVDSTFWGATDSFDSDEFMETHRERYVAGEW